MRYYAMIDGERRGPYELNQLIEAGVHPDTYVWCKGMDDWEKAEDVADICRHFRQHIFDMMHPSVRPAGSNLWPPKNTLVSNENPFDASDFQQDISRPPMPTLFLSIMMTLFCFPITGMVAVYYSYKARVMWQESVRSKSESSSPLYSWQERENLQRQAHDYGRKAKMWMGITFFLSLILYAFVGHHTF